MTQGAESFFALIAIVCRIVLVGMSHIMKVLGKRSAWAAKAVAARWLKLATSRPDPAIRRYSSWGVRY